MLKKIFTSVLQLYSKPAPRRTLRPTLRELHNSGTLRVFRRHSFLNVWEPLRESCDPDESLV
jgi:hypothetical protein